MASKFAFFVMFNIVTMVMAVQKANAQLGIGQILPIPNITGVVPCSLTDIANAPPFPNASVQLQCGLGNVLANTSTNNLGSFLMQLTQAAPVVLTDLLNGICMVVVATPLASCNASLPSNGGLLASALQPIGSRADGVIKLFKPSGFQFTRGL